MLQPESILLVYCGWPCLIIFPPKARENDRNTNLISLCTRTVNSILGYIVDGLCHGRDISRTNVIPVITEAPLVIQGSPSGVFGRQGVLEQGFIRRVWLPLLHIILPTLQGLI